MSKKLEKQILDALTAAPGQQARAMADKFGVDKKDVNSLLYGRLRSKVRQDKSYRWYITGGATNAENDDEGFEPEVFANTDLAQLCRYYLSCMGQDATGVSTFAESKFTPDYCELAALPKNGRDLFGTEGFQTLLGKIRKDRSRQSMYLGYPTSLKLVKSKKSSWEGYMVEPVILFPIEIEVGSNKPQLDTSYPIINLKPLQAYSNTERDALLDELVQLEEELGIGSEGGTIEIDELVMRLQSVRSEWPWEEKINPDKLIDANPPLSKVKKEGIFNRAVLILADKSPFTQGLEAELRGLAQKQQRQFSDTALGQWLTGEPPKAKDAGSSSPDKEHVPLLEVLPMNLEQREAVKSALTQPLTIITGPPGTGKSQVVTNLLVNAAWQGKRVLFASKNNKAVDVVETRINNLGPRPILLRVGSSAYQTRLAEYLIGLLSATASQDDELHYEEAHEIHSDLLQKSAELDAQVDKLIAARNETDALERHVEELRSELSDDLFSSIRELDLTDMEYKIEGFKTALSAADRSQQGLISNITWPLIKKSRFEAVNMRVSGLSSAAEEIELKAPDSFVDEINLPHWAEFLKAIDKRLSLIRAVDDYFQALQKLQKCRSLEEISADRLGIVQKIASNSDALWKCWLRLQPKKLSASDRSMLNKYNSVLKMVIEAGPEGNLSKAVYGKYYSLFPQASHLLPCWAVTSLSAKGKLPFEPGFFDLVIFDEASQCDIASALPLLYRAKAAVIIGDPKQLSHISSLQRGQDQQLLEKYGLVDDYPHWAYSYNSLFDLAAGMVSYDNVVSLLDHHRSHADVIEFSNSQFYEGRLRVATRYDNLRRLSQKEPGVRWVDVKGNVQRPNNGGAENKQEVQAIVDVLSDLVLKKKYQGSIGVVSPFRAQANAIRNAVDKDDSLAKALQKCDFLVDTVHKFQGDERDIMIFSPVLSKNMPGGGLVFLMNNGNLFNVAITRARAQLIVVGDLAACGKCDVDYLSNFAKYTQGLEKRSKASNRKKAQKDLGSAYPAVSNPEQVSDWEKIFYSALYEAGIKTLPQYQVEKFTLDLAIVDGDRMLDIEVDGEKYHRNWTGELCRRDQLRNQRMYELGWDVMRFWVYEIRDDLDNCIAKVREWQEQK
ncbi:MAG: AAA family ATPase [Pseudomonadota bacterium]|nr:DUF559 domain-containing protein [Pseudomonadota bacterium]QKK05618.1 MAG: AAA family ATPase [Pseudomonadota bacterium]